MTEEHMTTEEVLKKYSRKIGEQVKGFDSGNQNSGVQSISKEYNQFKTDMMPELSRYEKMGKGIG